MLIKYFTKMIIKPISLNRYKKDVNIFSTNLNIYTHLFHPNLNLTCKAQLCAI